MLSAIRTFAKSWISWIIFGALVISFGLISPNVRDAFSLNIGTWIVSAGGRKIEAAEFKDMYDNARKQQEQRMQQPLPLEMAVQMGLDKFVLQQVADQTSLSEMLKNLGLRPSTTLVEDEIKKAPRFFNAVTGAFDPKAFADFAAENHMTPAKMRQALVDDIAFGHFGFGVAQGMRLPRAYTAAFVSFQLEARDGVYFAIDEKSVGPIPVPTDAELQAFITKNADRLMLPEYRVISVVRFSAKDAGANVKVDDAEVQKVYNFRKEGLSTPEKRSLIQIPVKDQPTAAAVSARLQKGEDPMAVARSLKVSPVTMTDKPKSAFGDKRVADAAFALADGAVSGPIQGDQAWTVVKITGVTPGKEMTLEEARPQIIEELKAAAGQKASYALSEKYQSAHDAGDTLTAAAQKAGAPVTSIGPIAKDGTGADHKPVQGVDPKVLEAAFGLPAGGDSDIIDAGEGEYFAVRVEKVIPPALPTLAAIKPDLVKGLMEQTLAQKLIAKAQELQARIRKGESLEAVAASVGAKVVHVVGIDRASAQNHVKDLGQPFLEAMIQAKAGDVFVAPAAPPQKAVIIGKVEAVRQGDMADMARFTETLRPQIGMQYFDELRTGISAEARKQVGAKTDLNRARAAIGLPSEEIEKLDPKNAAKDAAKTKKK
jgi:peptidyl-prolyl cis-trans isomerase D